MLLEVKEKKEVLKKPGDSTSEESIGQIEKHEVTRRVFQSMQMIRLLRVLLVYTPYTFRNYFRAHTLAFLTACTNQEILTEQLTTYQAAAWLLAWSSAVTGPGSRRQTAVGEQKA